MINIYHGYVRKPLYIPWNYQPIKEYPFTCSISYKSAWWKKWFPGCLSIVMLLTDILILETICQLWILKWLWKSYGKQQERDRAPNLNYMHIEAHLTSEYSQTCLYIFSFLGYFIRKPIFTDSGNVIAYSKKQRFNVYLHNKLSFFLMWIIFKFDPWQFGTWSFGITFIYGYSNNKNIDNIDIFLSYVFSTEMPQNEISAWPNIVFHDIYIIVIIGCQKLLILHYPEINMYNKLWNLQF